MPIDWIAKNPRPNIPNEANQVSMNDTDYSNLMSMIIHVGILYIYCSI